jgi:hypothetical protein
MNRYHDIPVSRREVVDAVLEDVGDDRSSFAELASMLAALLHHEFHDQLEELKDAYRPISPDREHRAVEAADDEQAAASDRVQVSLRRVLTKGNYRRLTDADLEHAFKERSLFPVDVNVDFDVVDDWVIYARGQNSRKATVKRWFGLRKVEIDVPVYERVCLYLRFKTDDGVDPKRRKMLTYEPGLTVLKLFRNIPKADLEMLFPNTRIRMRLVDKLWIGVPAVVGTVPLLTKLAPAFFALAIVLGLRKGNIDYAAAIATFGGFAGILIFVVRQWDKFKSRKMLFLKMLSENLYFRNIDNNEGVLTRLIDEAEEEEHKETLLAYFFLHKEGELGAKDLDERIEAFLKERFSVEVDFEIDDALGKLVRYELATIEEDGRYRVVAVDDAVSRLRARWGRCLTPR